jgi:hypothetical protein
VGGAGRGRSDWSDRGKAGRRNSGGLNGCQVPSRWTRRSAIAQVVAGWWPNPKVDGHDSDVLAALAGQAQAGPPVHAAIEVSRGRVWTAKQFAVAARARVGPPSGCRRARPGTRCEAGRGRVIPGGRVVKDGEAWGAGGKSGDGVSLDASGARRSPGCSGTVTAQLRRLRSHGNCQVPDQHSVREESAYKRAVAGSIPAAHTSPA